MESKDVLSDIFDITSDADIRILQAIQKKHKDLFELAVELLRVGYKSFPVGRKLLKKEVSHPVERCLLGLYAQAFRLFRTTIVLNKSGFNTETRIILRSLLDTASYILYISEKDHDERLNLYRYSCVLSQYIAVSEFIQDHEDGKSKINMEWYEKERAEALKYFQEKYGADMTKREDRFKCGLRPSEAAKKIEDTFYRESLTKYYRTFHRETSRLGHGDNIFAFITPKEDKFILGINPREKHIHIFMCVSIRLFFHMMLQLNGLLGLSIEDDTINNLSEKIKVYDKEEN